MHKITYTLRSEIAQLQQDLHILVVLCMDNNNRESLEIQDNTSWDRLFPWLVDLHQSTRPKRCWAVNYFLQIEVYTQILSCIDF